MALKLDIVQYNFFFFFRTDTFSRGCENFRILKWTNGHHHLIIFLDRNEKKETENKIHEAKFRTSNDHEERWKACLTYNIT